jgi:hypothetical protein
MAGFLVHLLAAVICAGVINLIHFKFEYSLAAFVGSFVPDLIKYGATALKLGTVESTGITQDIFYQRLDLTFSNSGIWFSLGFLLFGLFLLLFHFHVIKKKKMEEYDELYTFFLIGILVHLLIDVFMQSTTFWV